MEFLDGSAAELTWKDVFGAVQGCCRMIRSAESDDRYFWHRHRVPKVGQRPINKAKSDRSGLWLATPQGDRVGNTVDAIARSTVESKSFLDLKRLLNPRKPAPLIHLAKTPSPTYSRWEKRNKALVKRSQAFLSYYSRGIKPRFLLFIVISANQRS